MPDQLFNVGVGTARQRLTALIYCAIEHPNIVTRHICREILADKLSRILSPGEGNDDRRPQTSGKGPG